MKAKIFVLSVCVLFFSTLSFSQESANITVEEIDICTAVEERQPVGIGSSFSSDAGRIYCFTKLRSDQKTASVSHVWYYKNKEMAEVELSVNAKTWRTWSSKRILDNWTGEWHVDILSPSGEVLATKNFTVE